MDARRLIQTLALVPHPEGGHYRRTWADGNGSAIYYLLCDGEVSAWHRVRARTEIWHFYAGAPLELSVLEDEAPAAGVRRIRLGPDVVGGDAPQVVVPADTWQRAACLGEWSLVGCTVTPPFTFETFELAPEGFLAG